MTTTIQLNEDIRDRLNEMKLHPRETYNDVIERMLGDLDEMNAKTNREIKKAMEEIESGMYRSLDDIMKDLGF
jgi:predicted transcriptional regulator